MELRTQLDQLTTKLTDLEDRDRRNNVRIVGLLEAVEGQLQQTMYPHFPTEAPTAAAPTTTTLLFFPDFSPSTTARRKSFSPAMKKAKAMVEAKPSVRIVEQRDKSALLQCEVRGAFSKPELHWEDGAGNFLPVEEVTDRGRIYDVILQTTVYKTGIYRCVATQKGINHQAHADIPVSPHGFTGGHIAGLVIASVGFVVLVVYRWWYRIKSCLMKGAPQLSIRILEPTNDRVVLQCEVRGASPKPKLHWEDGAGNKLQADEPQEIKRGRLYDIFLRTIVTKTDIYRCVVTQKEINYQTYAETYVHFPAPTPYYEVPLLSTGLKDGGDDDETSIPFMPSNGNSPV
ncbi:uncharacterized protein LOC133976707 [Scomber scombrus]|uniref:uncharacterized protein LOC133976707 n=1 Tax=Scomber scombrus TaxID=13677 RepID=UPI002DD94E3F|nr:uncharacterized protein LOC133976707 [Scomber scombrus]